MTDEAIADQIAVENVRLALAGILTEPLPGTLACQVKEFAFEVAYETVAIRRQRGAS